MNPVVSIVMPAYNRAQYIREAIESCLAQTYEKIELIVIDDGSTDDTVAIVNSYGERVRLIEQPNQGPAIARNTGIVAATGDYIQFCDSDDLLHPEKIERCLPLIINRSQVGAVYNKMRQVAADGVTQTGLPDFPPDDYFETPHLFCKILDHVGSPLQTSSLLVRKTALEQVGMYRADPDHRCAEDWDLLLRLSSDYAIVGLPEVLTYYRHHSDALTQDTILMAEGRLQTTLYALDYPARHQCLDDDAFNQFLAGRYHTLAMVYWRTGRRAEARQQLAAAIRLTPQGRRIRQVMRHATYLMTAHAFESLLLLAGKRK